MKNEADHRSDGRKPDKSPSRVGVAGSSRLSEESHPSDASYFTDSDIVNVIRGGREDERERCIEIVRSALAGHGEYIKSVGEKIAEKISQG